MRGQVLGPEGAHAGHGTEFSHELIRGSRQGPQRQQAAVGINLHRARIKDVIEHEHAFQGGRGHAVVGNHHEVGREAQLAQAHPHFGEVGVDLSHGGGDFR